MDSGTNSLKLQDPSCTFDDCLISALLKKLFAAKQSSKATTIDIGKTIDEVSDDLSALPSSSAELTRENFQLLEQSLPGVAHRYAIIRKNGRPVLFAYYQLFTPTRDNFNLDANNTLTRGLIKLFVGLKRSKILMLGNALHNEKDCYCYDKKIFTSDEATEAVAALAERIAANEGVSAIILKELPELTPATQQLFQHNGYIHPFEDNVMEMTIAPEWKTLEDYIGNLSRKYKARATKIITALDGVTVKNLSEAEIIKLEPEIHRLFSATVRQQPFTLTHPAEGFFSGLKKVYKDCFEITGYFKNGHLIAFYSAFTEDDTYNIYYIGFDYAENEAHQLYFNILFSGLEKAITSGRKLLQLGRTSFDAKASLGATPRSLNYLMKLEHIPNFVVNRFARYFASFENSKWKQRNPLKAANAAIS